MKGKKKKNSFLWGVIFALPKLLTTLPKVSSKINSILIFAFILGERLIIWGVRKSLPTKQLLCRENTWLVLKPNSTGKQQQRNTKNTNPETQSLLIGKLQKPNIRRTTLLRK